MACLWPHLRAQLLHGQLRTHGIAYRILALMPRGFGFAPLPLSVPKLHCARSAAGLDKFNNWERVPPREAQEQPGPEPSPQVQEAVGRGQPPAQGTLGVRGAHGDGQPVWELRAGCASPGHQTATRLRSGWGAT